MRAADWSEFWGTPLRLRAYLLLVAAAAVTLPLVVDAPADATVPTWVTAGALILGSVVNVEISRVLSGGLSRTHQPHKALSAWAFATALLLPPVWLLVVVPVTYAHARWRGLRIPLWKWVGSGFFLVLCGVAATLVREAGIGSESNWMSGDGARGFLTLLAAAAAFLALEALLFSGSALLNRAEDEVWLRDMLTSAPFYLTESGVLLLGGLFSAVWTGGIWFTILFVPLYTLVQHAVLLGPLRERAALAGELSATNKALAQKNAALEQGNQFKIDLITMLGHEIGNPLTSVQGFAQVGVEHAAEGDAAAAHAALVVVERNAERMRDVLHDILLLVTSDRGGLTAVPEICWLAPRLAAAASELPAGHRPEVVCADDLAALIQPGHLDQILGNLILNAEKYGAGVTRIVAAADGSGGVELTVTDAGPGVPEAFRDRLFDRHSRGAGTAHEVAGNGMGLFISRELARANGGDLVHQEASPGGSSFVVRLAGVPSST